MDKVWDKSSKIVLGTDAGTTCSAVSFVYLLRGSKPQVQRVTRWPGQFEHERQCKLPSWIWYNEENKPVKFGAEAYNLDEEDAKERGWKLSKYFKLHLHPADMAPLSGFLLEPLPTGVKIGQIYGDFFGYLLKHTQSFFEEHIFRGREVWQSLSKSMEVVIAHPNGWSTREQGVLRESAITARLSSAKSAYRRISFVPEAEASVQFCLNSEPLVSSLQAGMKFIVCDAGGSTVDTTVYAIVELVPMLKLKEVKSSACIQAGSIFVDQAAESFIRSRLEGKELDEEDIEAYVKDGMEHFTNIVKPNFTGAEPVLDIKIGKRRLNIPSINVQGGRMKLAGNIVRSFFDVCVEQILASAALQAEGVRSPFVFLVGGFGDSPYLRSALKNSRWLSGRLTTSNSPGAKAVADGATIWAVARSVVSRATRYSYGIEARVSFEESNKLHHGRRKVFLPSGRLVVDHGWSEIIPKDTVLSYDSCLREIYTIEEYTSTPTRPDVKVILYSSAHSPPPPFMRDKKGVFYSGFQPLCTVKANLPDARSLLVKQHSSITGSYWVLSYKVGLRFGGTELSAFIEWEQNGETMTGPATIVPMMLD
ncbi:hypothetical protein BDV93DRAFT_499702 [Ceratobasidium sp. AG-I]|nr:hypothetical protein BDV93DRAFT_499702 [Ceratobasidium sp. AG-I]